MAIRLACDLTGAMDDGLKSSPADGPQSRVKDDGWLLRVGARR